MATKEDNAEAMVVTSVRLPATTLARLEALAPSYRHGRSTIIRRAIDELLEKIGR